VVAPVPVNGVEHRVQGIDIGIFRVELIAARAVVQYLRAHVVPLLKLVKDFPSSVVVGAQRDYSRHRAQVYGSDSWSRAAKSAPDRKLAPQKTSFSKPLASSAPWALSVVIGLWPVF
jgi:hypothetical protein